MNPHRRTLSELDGMAGLWGTPSPIPYIPRVMENDATNALMCLIASLCWVLRFWNVDPLCARNQWSPQPPYRPIPENLVATIGDAAEAVRAGTGMACLYQPRGWPVPEPLSLADAGTAAAQLIHCAREMEENLARYPSPDVGRDHELFSLWGQLEWLDRQLPREGYEPCFPDRVWEDAGFCNTCAHSAVLWVRTSIILTLGGIAVETRCGEITAGRAGLPWFVPFWVPEARPLAVGKLPKVNQGRWMAQLRIETERLRHVPGAKKVRERKRRGHPELTPTQKQQMIREYEHYKASGLTQRQYIQKRGCYDGKDEAESRDYLNACRKHWEKHRGN